MEAIKRSAKKSIEEAKTRSLERFNDLNKTIYANLKHHVENPSNVYQDFDYELLSDDEQYNHSILDHFTQMGFVVELRGNSNQILYIPSKNWVDDA